MFFSPPVSLLRAFKTFSLHLGLFQGFSVREDNSGAQTFETSVPALAFKVNVVFTKAANPGQSFPDSDCRGAPQFIFFNAQSTLSLSMKMLCTRLYCWFLGGWVVMYLGEHWVQSPVHYSIHCLQKQVKEFMELGRSHCCH